MSESQLLKELAKVRWNSNPKEYTGRFAAVAERGLGLAPDELADYYCTELPTDLHLLITNNGQVKYQSWEQAATAATRLYEPKQSVLEVRERASRAIRVAIQANGPRRRQEIGNRPGGTHTNDYECQGRGHPARVCPSRGERTKRPGEICKKCGDGTVKQWGLSVVGGERSRPRSHGKGMICAVATGPNAIPVSLEWGSQLLRTGGRTNTNDGHAEGTQTLSETRWESGSASILSEESPDATTDSSRKPAEPTEDGYRSDATEIVPHW
ncbi:hypothetical protein ENH_00067350 [Eimeria necatrix]|uniref:Uncharacterized protein n=1 Tax=Eimeria necatrix TaxID=51315 RepID=U6MPF1_9EIME|nr:hypothetical protein ENH_00067350 [Eimeria necatrix]CDJ64364.1 hypothetical protein ENH_00067350 [Eimeria necatrix]